MANLVMSKVLILVVVLSAFLVFSLLCLFFYLWELNRIEVQGSIKSASTEQLVQDVILSTGLAEDGAGSEVERSGLSLESATFSFKKGILSALDKMNSKDFLLLLAVVIVVFMGLILWQIWSPRNDAIMGGADLDDIEDSPTTYFSTWTPIYVIALIGLIIVFILAAIPRLTSGKVKIKGECMSGKFTETILEYDGEFSPKLRKAITSMLGLGMTMNTWLKTAFDSVDANSVGCLTNDISDSDYLALIKHFGRSCAVNCPEWQESLSKPVEVAEDMYPEEVPLVDFDSSLSKRLEIVFTPDFGAQAKTFSPRALELSYIQVEDYHVFVDDGGKFILVAEGDLRAAQIVAILALQEIRAGCSIALSGRRLLESIQKGLKLFAPKDELTFTLVHQSQHFLTHYVDIIQAGILNVAVYNSTTQMISDQTAFAQNVKITGTSSTADVRLYRFEASKNNKIFLYTNAIAYNLFPKVIAKQPYAIAIASKAAFVLSQATNLIHTPHNADQGNVKSSPIIPSDHPEILVISKLIK